MQVLLMFVFSVIERLCAGDLRGNGAMIALILHGFLKARQACMGGAVLLRR